MKDWHCVSLIANMYAVGAFLADNTTDKVLITCAAIVWLVVLLVIIIEERGENGKA